ncbi:MAG: beta-lactamase family protein [Asgard group archaeon]|nr:beta-lactamase family protein [Asgard group archaeon]
MLEETKRKEIGDEFTRAINSKSEVKMQAFIMQYWDPETIEVEGSEELIDYFFDIIEEVEVIENYEIILENEKRLAIKFKNKSLGEWVKCIFILSTNNPGTIDQIGMRLVDSPKDADIENTLERKLPKLLDNYILALCEKDLFSGAIVLLKDEKIVKQWYKGFADKAFSILPNAKTRFDIGSMGKMFTALAIGKLVQEEKIAFEDTIASVLPELKIEQADKITIHHLLTHTSGLGDIFCPEFYNNKEKYTTIRELVSLLENKPLNFQPGERFQYSNGGYDLLGLIIEERSGIDYFNFVKKHIFEPIGMINSDSFYIDDPIPNRAVGYTKIGVGIRKTRYTDWKVNTRVVRRRGCAAGSGYSTIDDLVKFSNALRTNKILNQELLQLITTAQIKRVEDTESLFYGYGFGVTKYENFCRYGHNGGSPGVNTYFGIYEPLGYTLIVLSNYDSPAADRVAKKFDNFLVNIKQ